MEKKLKLLKSAPIVEKWELNVSAKLSASVIEPPLILISLIRELTVFRDVTSFMTRQISRMSPKVTRKALW